MVGQVRERFRADACSIYLTEADLQHLTLRATEGLAPESVDSVRVVIGEGLVGLAVEQRRPVALERAREHPRFRYFPETGEERFASLMAAPMFLGNTPIGVIVVQTEKPRRFESPEIELLQTCAGLLSPVVVNAELLNLVAQGDPKRTDEVMTSLGQAGLPLARRPAERSAARNVELRGMPAARGVAIGPVYRLDDPVDLERLDYTPNADSAQERDDLKRALEEARRELFEVREDVGLRFGPEFSAVFNTHIQILEDKGFVTRLDARVEETGNALAAVREVLRDYRRTFESIEDPYFRERGTDIEDVGRRVMANLLGVRHQNPRFGEGAVLVVDHILPTHFALLGIERVGGIVSEHGGANSHGAIFARTLEIPLVTAVPGVCAVSRSGERAIVDGSLGRIYLSPEADLCAEYERAQHRYEVAVEHLDALGRRPAETRDGRRIALTANAGMLSDLRLADRHGAEGVGLFRTELLALAHRGMPREDEQEQLYERVAGQMAPRPVTIRTLDLGGDKPFAESLGTEPEENPQLGRRSIRLSLANERAFRAQIRAILRSSAKGVVRLLLPMISSLVELRRAKEIVALAREEVAQRGVPFDENMPVGIMIEVPSAALIADALAAESDFFSVGTNDLTQYTLAVDRGNERVAHLYQPLHPAVFALIDRSVRAGRRAGIPTSICGEMAGNPLAVPLLVGLGVGELSAAPSAVPLIKEIVRALHTGDVERDARDALEAGTAAEVHAIAAARLRECGLLEHPDVGLWLRPIVERAQAGD